MTTNLPAIRIILLTVAAAFFTCVGTLCILSYFGIQIPPELNTLTGTLAGSLGSMLVKTSPTTTGTTTNDNTIQPNGTTVTDTRTTTTTGT